MPAHIATLPSGHPIACDIQSVDGYTLKLRCSIAFDLRAVVKVENEAILWMGEVRACQSDSSGFSIEIEVSQILHDPPAVERMAARFRHTPSKEETSRQLA